MPETSDVYFNLHKQCFSVRRKGRVVDHADHVRLAGCTFVVQPAGARKVRETGVKNVHAFVRGTVVDIGWPDSYGGWQVRYNPRVHRSFMRVHYHPLRETAVDHADLVSCDMIEGAPYLMAWWFRRG